MFRPLEQVYSLAELMEQLDWDAYVRRWLAYTQGRLSRYGSNAFVFALQASDCVQEAISLTLEGRRRFERGTKSEFFAFMCGVIKSLVSHAGEKTRRGVAHITADRDDAEPGAIGEGQLKSAEDLEHDFLFRDDIERFLEWVDEDLALYARLRADETWGSTEEYAQALGLSVSEVRNMDRRLRRRREQWTSQRMTSATVM